MQYVGEKVGFSYEAECTALKSVTLTLNFDGSVNFAIDDYGGNALSESAGNVTTSILYASYSH